MMKQASRIFNFIRGAVRSVYGIEDFRGKRIIVYGMDGVGQALLTMLCFDDVKLFFHDSSIVNYQQAHLICSSVEPMISGNTYDDVDVFIDLVDGFIMVGDNNSVQFPIADIGDEPYEQGIHEYYL
jgi:hypothetical protein